MDGMPCTENTHGSEEDEEAIFTGDAICTTRLSGKYASHMHMKRVSSSLHIGSRNSHIIVCSPQHTIAQHQLRCQILSNESRNTPKLGHGQGCARQVV
jgi:hypothetical protein